MHLVRSGVSTGTTPPTCSMMKLGATGNVYLGYAGVLPLAAAGELQKNGVDRIPFVSISSQRTKGVVSCSSSSPSLPSSTTASVPLTSSTSIEEGAKSNIMVLDRNEFRRGVGLCVVNRQGLVFAAR